MTNCPTLDKNCLRKLKTQEKGLVYIRDALSFYLMDVKIRHNLYNITIIIVSLTTAFFETLNTEFGWSYSCGGGRKKFVTRFAVVYPIAMTTFITLVSSMMKFERLSEKMEETTKSIEKCHYAINRQREICDETDPCSNVAAASLCFREALMNAEMLWLSRMDPSTKRKYLKKSDRIHRIFDRDNQFFDQNNLDVILLIEQSFKPDKPPDGIRIGFCKLAARISGSASKQTLHSPMDLHSEPDENSENSDLAV